MKAQTPSLIAVLLMSGSVAVAQEPSAPSGVAQATAIARENSIAVSIAINGQAIAEAENGGEALATAIRDAIGDTLEDSATAPSPSPPASAGTNTRPVEAASAPAPRPCVYHLCIRLENDRVAVLTLTRSQLECLLKPKIATKPKDCPRTARSVAKCH